MEIAQHQQQNGLFFFFFSPGELLVSICFTGMLCNRMTARLAFLQKPFTWVTVLLLERKYALHSTLYCKHWQGNEVIKIKKVRDLRIFISVLLNVKKITPPIFLFTFLQRGLQSLFLKTTEQAIELEQLWLHPHFTSVQYYCPVLYKAFW